MTSTTSPDVVIKQLTEENERLKAQLAALSISQSAQSNGVTVQNSQLTAEEACPLQTNQWDGTGHGLTKEQIGRYSRQIILPSFGIEAQAKLCNASVLVIGAGGLGSPALLYLAAAGVGRIGIVDKDTVELSNIHRQIIHTESTVGVHKALSAAQACRAINSSIQIETHLDGFSPSNAVALVSQYDVVIDASDNAPTRYLINDACAATKRPLVSGAAIGTDGQLTVYCGGDDCPCYRCLFPVAPPSTSCARCVDAGVLGVVPGIIGTMQAAEAIKILSGIGQPMSRKLLLMDTVAARFHVVKLRPRSATCVACGDDPLITADNVADYDYAEFTGQAPNDAAPKSLTLLKPEQRVTPTELQEALEAKKVRLLIDVRPAEQFNICHLPEAVHAPYAKFEAHVDEIKNKMTQLGIEVGSGEGVYVVCRRGNDSQRAVDTLCGVGIASKAVDVIGGMELWAKDVDPQFPTY